MYTLAQYKEIEAAGFDYRIPDNILEAIRAIASIVGAVSYSPAPVFPKPAPKHSAGALGEVVGLLNKLTTDTYDKISTLVVELIDHLDPAETDKLCEAVFRIASGNRFYSKIYANLCKLLCKFPAFKEILDRTCALRAGELAELTSDGRALTLFLTNLALNNTIQAAVVVGVAQQLQQLVEDHVDDAAKKPQIEEWSEHLALMLTQQRAFTASCGLQDRMLRTSQLIPKAHPGLSIKTVFRYLDILEHFN